MKLKKIAIILIRKNSKGLTDKNIKSFCGKPLCFYTIDIAINSEVFDEIWISSDSQVYLDLYREKYEEKCKYIIRNKEVASDSSTTYETLECLFNNIKEDFIFMNLQVTSPLRKIEHVEEVMKMFKGCDHIVFFSELKYSKSLFMNLNDGYLLPSRHGGDYRRQDEPSYIYPNGSMWVSTKNNYLRDKTFYTKKLRLIKWKRFLVLI